ncbi:MAG: hypothetical protein ACE5K7_04225, partial [Phycisphaerae bacterium]
RGAKRELVLNAIKRREGLELSDEEFEELLAEEAERRGLNPHKFKGILEREGRLKEFRHGLENERALNVARRRINDLLDASVDVSTPKRGIATMTAVFVKPTIAWRDLKCLCSGGTDHSNFRLPDQFFQVARTLHKEFLRGFADVAVMPSYGDGDQARRVRIAFPVVHDNQVFARQLVKLFEVVGVEARLLPGTAAKRGARKEHRIRAYAEDYEKVGFAFPHKQRLLKLFADYNRTL